MPLYPDNRESVAFPQHRPYTRMPEDAYSRPPRARRVAHRGGNGLFDDIDELDETAHADAHEMHHVQNPRHGEQSSKEAKAARRIAMGKPAESRLEGLVARVFARHGKKGDASGDGEGKEEDLSNRTAGAARGKSMVEQNAVYPHRDAAAAADSPWLRECGMVRVQSDIPGGCLIVPRTYVFRDDFAYREDRDVSSWI